MVNLRQGHPAREKLWQNKEENHNRSAAEMAGLTVLNLSGK